MNKEEFDKVRKVVFLDGRPASDYADDNNYNRTANKEYEDRKQVLKAKLQLVEVALQLVTIAYDRGEYTARKRDEEVFNFISKKIELTAKLIKLDEEFNKDKTTANEPSDELFSSFEYYNSTEDIEYLDDIMETQRIQIKNGYSTSPIIPPNGYKFTVSTVGELKKKLEFFDDSLPLSKGYRGSNETPVAFKTIFGELVIE